jgi:hypothetical protein
MEHVDKSTGEVTDQPERDVVGETSAFVARDLLDSLVLEIKLLQRPWDALPQAEQDEMIERLRKQVLNNVRQAIGIIVADERAVMPATVESVTFKDGIKAVLKISKHAGARHDLADHEGQDLIIVMVDPGDYMAGVHDVRGDPDQAEIGVENSAADAIARARGQKPSDDPAADAERPT